METVIRYVLIIVVLAHGIGHVMGVLAAWTSVPVGFTDRPWVLPGGVAVTSAVGKLFSLAWLLALVGFIAAAIGMFIGTPWWPTVIVVAAILSLIAILPWWNTVPPGARFGATLADIVILVIMLIPAWREAAIAFFA